MKTEKCVLCGEDTGIAETTDVGLRYFYVEGAGQLCQKCFEKQMNNKTNQDEN